MENTKKRLKEEAIKDRKYASQNVVSELINPIDMLDQIVNMEVTSPEVANYQIGFKMITNQIVDILKNEGLKQIEASVGKEFNPAFMQAVETEHNEDMVISIDDDMFYDPKMIAAVLEEYNRNPIPCVLHYAGCGGLIEITEGIKYTITQKRVKSSVRNYFIGQCAFTPNSFPLETLEPKIVELRKKICPKCDESFLHPYLIKDNIPIVFMTGLHGIEENEMQNVAIRNDLHFNLVNINGKEYKKADLYKLKVLQTIPELQESWKREFPNYNFNEVCNENWTV